MIKDKTHKNQNWRDIFNDCYKEDICVGLRIMPYKDYAGFGTILHESNNKRLPVAAVLRVETKKEVFQVVEELDYRYEKGDTKLRPYHLSILFWKMADELHNSRDVKRDKND